jgi:hypothetical protein
MFLSLIIHTYIICFSFVVWNPLGIIYFLLRTFAHEGFNLQEQSYASIS